MLKLKNANIHKGDCLEVLRTMPDNSIDSIVTDPPYGISFMNKHWDYNLPDVEVFKEMLRVLKPGGHILCACGTRTQHRMAVNIEDAGFEIRDVITWLYGSGFPKSLNLKDKWQGWGTALKPACEFWTLARKPLSEKTVPANVLKHGTGALNIDASRIEATDQHVLDAAVKRMAGNSKNNGAFQQSKNIVPNSAQGRWPANLMLDEQTAMMLDEQSGILASRFFYTSKASKSERNKGCEALSEKKLARSNSSIAGNEHKGSGFNQIQEMKNHHPTVKPIKLMSYLVKLITPPRGIVLDPYMGSGSTGVAALEEGFKFYGIERDKDYFKISKARIKGVAA